MTKIYGFCDARFKAVEEILKSNLDSGKEVGASIVVNLDGKDVLDLWGGFADGDRNRPWEKDTITNVWSTTKNITSLAALMLIDRGVLAADEKVSTYWPDFAANGKEDIRVRHILSHTSGLPGWENPLTVEDAYDVTKSAALLAQQAPWWTPGAASGYHSLTFGHLIGELVRRRTGTSLGQFIVEEIAGPIGADFQLGAAEQDWPRIADIIPPEGWTVPELTPGSLPAKVTLNPPATDPLIALTPEFRRAQLGSSNGHGNARSIARILSAISLGGQASHHRFLSAKTIDMIFDEQSNGIDLVLGTRIRFGIGYGLTGKHIHENWLPGGRVCYWGGWGGSMAIMDLDHRMTISYVMNKMEIGETSSKRTGEYVTAIYQALKAQ